MIVCLDVHYLRDRSVAACLLFQEWGHAQPAGEITVTLEIAEPYAPGEFYKRELKPLLAVLDRVRHPLDAVVIDGYVWLDDKGTPGLGAHLYRAMQERIPVIGVAKTRFRDASFAVPIVRGRSRQPLFITSAGIPAEEAAGYVLRMHGPHRIPTLLRRVDRLSRNAPKHQS